MQDYWINSSELQHLREVVSTSPEIVRALGCPVQFTFIVDTNVVFRELLWLVQKRRSPNAQTALQEIVKAGTAELHAPTLLEHEVSKHLPTIAQNKGIPLAQLAEEWENYRTSITFLELEKDQIYEPRAIDDPDDIPFLVLQDLLNASGVITYDKDLARMGARTVNAQCLVYLRSYSRAAAIEFSIKVNGYRVASLSLHMLTETLGGLGAVFRGVKLLPKPVLIAGGVAAAFALLHPTSRTKIFSVLSDLLAGTNKLFGQVCDYVEQQSQIVTENKMLADEALQQIPQSVRALRKRSPI